MAPKPQPPATPPAAPPVTPSAAGTADTAKPAFDWDGAPATVAMPSKLVTAAKRVDVLAEIPERIRKELEHSLMKTVARYAAKADSTAKRVRIEPYWALFVVATEDMGAEFSKLAARYAKYRPADKDMPHADVDSPKGQITVRTGAVTRYRQTDAGPVASPDASPAESFLAVRYSARPFEGRKDTSKAPGA